MPYQIQTINSPVGELHLVSEGEVLRAVLFDVEGDLRVDLTERFAPLEDRETPVIAETKRQLQEYFLGMRRSFGLPMQPLGTLFQQRVWKALAEIPYAGTRTYGQQAASIGYPRATRAVGRSNGLNPLCIVVPCHRVIGANGKLTGFGGGLPAKKYLLQHEQRVQKATQRRSQKSTLHIAPAPTAAPSYQTFIFGSIEAQGDHRGQV